MIRVTDACRTTENSQSAGFHGMKRRRDLRLSRGSAHDDDGRRMRFHDPPRRLQAVQPGHVDIHRDDIRSCAGNRLERFFAIVGDAHHLDLRVCGQKSNEKLADHS